MTGRAPGRRAASSGAESESVAGGEAEAALERAGWPRVRERILRGISHDLNGRAGTLPVLVEALAGDGMGIGADEILGHVREECRRVTVAARQLQILTQPPGTVEPFALSGVLSDAVALQRRLRGPENRPVRVDAGSGDVALHTDPVLLGRLILIVLAEAGWASGGPEGEIDVRVVRDAGTTSLVVEAPSRREDTLPEAPTRRGAPMPEAPVGQEDLAHAAEAARLLGIGLVAETSGGDHRIRLGLRELDASGIG